MDPYVIAGSFPSVNILCTIDLHAMFVFGNLICNVSSSLNLEMTDIIYLLVLAEYVIIIM